MGLVLREALDRWSLLNFDVDRVCDVIKAMELTDRDIHQLYGFNLTAMINAFVAEFGTPRPEYKELRTRRRARKGKILDHRYELLVSFNPGDGQHTNTERSILTFVATQGILDKLEVCDMFDLSLADFVSLRGLSGPFLMGALEDFKSFPVRPAERKKLEDEYERIHAPPKQPTELAADASLPAVPKTPPQKPPKKRSFPLANQKGQKRARLTAPVPA